MEYQNRTAFPVLLFDSTDISGKIFSVAVARVTLAITEEGQLKPAAEQPPLLLTDEWNGEANKSSVRQESDLAPYKPWCDVVVVGNAHVPGGHPMRRFEAGVRVTRKGNMILDKRLTVTGPRYWQRRVWGSWHLSTPEPIHALPLRYENAYGGECRIEAGSDAMVKIPKEFRLSEEDRCVHPDGDVNAPVAHSACEKNPVGKGYSTSWFRKAANLNRVPAAQLESPLEPITKINAVYAPQGLGVIGRAWKPRRDLCGTLDDTFIRSGRALPEDFDFGYWNGAHPDLQTPWLTGDETIDLINIPVTNCRAERIDSQGNNITRLFLPGTRICAVKNFLDHQRQDCDFNIDTLIVDAERSTVSLVFRLKIAADPAMRSIEIESLTGIEREILAQHVESLNRQVQQNKEAVS